jgi:hypothetical protein
MSEFKPIETQEAFDAAIKERLERAKKTVTDEVKKQYEGWISPEDAKKSADRITELTQQVTDLTAKNAAAELSALRTRIAHETGLPYELADRLRGDDEKAIRADAEAFSRLTAPKPAPSPSYSPEAPVGNATDAAFAALASELNA